MKWTKRKRKQQPPRMMRTITVSNDNFPYSLGSWPYTHTRTNVRVTRIIISHPLSTLNSFNSINLEPMKWTMRWSYGRWIKYSQNPRTNSAPLDPLGCSFMLQKFVVMIWNYFIIPFCISHRPTIVWQCGHAKNTTRYVSYLTRVRGGMGVESFKGKTRLIKNKVVTKLHFHMI